MGKMTCNWKLGDVRKTIDFVIEKDLKKVEDELFNICLSTAKSAKDGHTYKNYKGQLESSVGVIILKNRQEVTQWSMVASSGSDPAKGLQDIKNLIYNKIVGKHSCLMAHLYHLRAWSESYLQPHRIQERLMGEAERS